jgi:hypothetical protein
MSGTDLVADRSRRSRGWATIAFGCVFGLVGTAISAAFLSAGALTGSSGLSIGGAVPVLIAVGGWGAVIWGGHNLWLSRQLGVPTLTVPPAEPLCLGGTLVARFERRGGRKRPLGPVTLTAELVGEERATYRQGTDTHTATATIRQIPLRTVVDPTPGVVAGQIVVTMPLDAPPSLTLRRNVVVWRVRVTVRVADGSVPDDTGTFVVPVVPAVATSAMGRPPTGEFG